MKIISLQAENLKRLVAVQITPDGNLVQITGKNGQGKTSVLDSIWWALDGAKHIQSVPIRQGATEARIRLDLGEIIVTRTFAAGKDGETTSKITVENAQGAKFPTPQTMLDELLGSLTFDPLAFARMEPKAQLATLRSFVTDYDFAAADAANKADYEMRRELTRKVKEYEIAARNMGQPFDLPPSPDLAVADEISEKEYVDKMTTAAQRNKEIDHARANRGNALLAIETLKKEIARLTENLGKMEKAYAELPPLEEPQDLTAMNVEFNSICETNKKIRATAGVVKLAKQAKECADRADKLTQQMDKRTADAAEAVRAAALPVDGITFTDEAVLLNAVPFNQASDAEQLRASVAVAMALNPKLKVIRVRDGSLLDEDSMKLLEAMAVEKDYQVWIERVDGSGKVGFVLENGMVKEG